MSLLVLPPCMHDITIAITNWLHPQDGMMPTKLFVRRWCLGTRRIGPRGWIVVGESWKLSLAILNENTCHPWSISSLVVQE